MPGPTKVTWAKPPAILVALAAAVGTIGIAMMAVGSQTTGISTDEPIHVRRLNNYFDSGFYVRAFEVEHTPPGQVPSGAYVYAPVTSLIQHHVNRAFDYETLGKAKTRPYNYAVRHAVIASMAIAGLLAAAGIAWAILRSWRWGVVAGGMLAAMPLWVGHGMFNVKDIPVASGHTLITLGLVLLAVTKPATRWLPIVASAATLAAGTVLTLGTRPGAWPSLLASLIVFAVIAVRARPEQTKAHQLRILATVTLALAASYAVLLAVYPRVFSTPLTTLKISAAGSADYTCRNECPPLDRSYALVHLVTDLPLGLVALVAAGTAAAVILLVVQRRRVTALDCLALVGSQAFALMAGAIILNSNLYHGLRQLLFIVPALAVLGTVGLAALVTKARPGLPRRALTVAAGGALILPLAVQLAMFPYQYTYINVAAEQLQLASGPGVFAGKVEDDYWRTSFREYAHRKPQDVKTICSFMRYGGTPTRNEIDCRTRGAYTLSSYWRDRPAPDRPRTDEFYVIMHGDREAPPNCRPYSKVERWRNLERAVISGMFECHDPTRDQILQGRETINQSRARAGLPPEKFWKLPPVWPIPTNTPSVTPTPTPTPTRTMSPN